MSLSRRLRNIAKTQLNNLKDRLDKADEEADFNDAARQAEVDAAKRDVVASQGSVSLRYEGDPTWVTVAVESNRGLVAAGRAPNRRPSAGPSRMGSAARLNGPRTPECSARRNASPTSSE